MDNNYMNIQDLIDDSLINYNTNKDCFIEDTDYEKALNVYIDNNGNYKFNLNSGLYIDINEKDVQYYVVNNPIESWQLLSYKLYGTPRLVWILYKLNNITAKNIFEPLKIGQKIKTIRREVITNILTLIN